MFNLEILQRGHFVPVASGDDSFALSEKAKGFPDREGFRVVKADRKRKKNGELRGWNAPSAARWTPGGSVSKLSDYERASERLGRWRAWQPGRVCHVFPAGNPNSCSYKSQRAFLYGLLCEIRGIGGLGGLTVSQLRERAELRGWSFVEVSPSDWGMK